jgi:hypothetical protein
VFLEQELYSELNYFNKSPIVVHLGADLEICEWYVYHTQAIYLHLL